MHLRTTLTLGISIVLGLAVLGFCGCQPALSKVHGKITLPDGQPAQNVTVTFHDTVKHVGASGTADSTGVYQLSTNSAGDGAPPGNYVVTVHQPPPADSSQSEGPRIFPKRYEGSSSSGLSFEVKPGDNEFNIALEAK